VLAISLPGNEQRRWEKLQKKLRQLGKKLEKMLPKER
jgi:surfactin synthase thioesterase subunit